MTAALIVSTHGKQTGKSMIEKDYFVIGRSRRNDLLLDDKNVSREHAIILHKEGTYTIQDRGSRNGTVVNGEAITSPTVLKDGDTIVLGPFELKFFTSGEAQARPAHVVEEEAESKTHFIDTDKARRSARKASEAKKTSGSLKYKLVATDGPLRGTGFDNWEGVLSIGRAPENKVVLPDDGASHSHAKIWEQDGLFYIEDLGSSNGTFVQGVRVKNARLKNGQRIRIGGSTFVFTAVDPQKRKFMVTIAAVSTIFVVLLVMVAVLMTPEDPLAVFMTQGKECFKKGEYTLAKEAFEKVLQARPSDPEAKHGIQMAKQGLEREEILNEARKSAEDEQYDAALETCYQLLRQYPNYKKAKELEQVITTVKNAQVAFGGKNWPDAIEYLKKARQQYPTSALLSRMLDRAQSELVAQQNLGKAKEFLANKQSDNAQELLLGIPQTSAYYIEARGILQDIKSSDAIAGIVMDARDAFRDGNTDRALTLVGNGLAQQPNNAQLLDLKKHMEKVVPLARYVEPGNSLLQSDDTQAIRDMIDACNRLVDAEIDAQNKLRVNAATLAAGLQARLTEIEREAMSKAEALLAQNDRIGAYKHFAEALKANPANKRAASVVEDIRSGVVADCKKYYQQGLVHEELNQRDLAIAAFEKVVATGLEGDSYYERAKSKMQNLKGR